MITKEKVMCKNCGEEIAKEQGFKYQDGYVCECCFYDEFFISSYWNKRKTIT